MYESLRVQEYSIGILTVRFAFPGKIGSVDLWPYGRAISDQLMRLAGEAFEPCTVTKIAGETGKLKYHTDIFCYGRRSLLEVTLQHRYDVDVATIKQQMDSFFTEAAVYINSLRSLPPAGFGDHIGPDMPVGVPEYHQPAGNAMATHRSVVPSVTFAAAKTSEPFGLAKQVTEQGGVFATLMP